MMNLSNDLKPALEHSRVTIELNNHYRRFYGGMTGMGKSHLMKHDARMFRRAGGKICIVDGPDQGYMPRDENTRLWQEPATRGPGTVDKPLLVKSFNRKADVQLYRPKVPGWQDAGLLSYLSAILNEENRLVILDETIGIADVNHVPDELAQIWTQGRKHNVPAWVASQRLAKIPEIFLSQAEQWFLFFVKNRKDREKAAEWTGDYQIVDNIIPPRYYWYQGPGMHGMRLMSPIGDS